MNLPFTRKTLILLGAFILIVIAAVPSVYFYNQYQKNQQNLKNPNQAAVEEAKVVVAKVGQLIELPKDEQPTVATISDVNKLKDQTFFANAQNGDKVLIYSKAKKGIIYRPSTNKIIEVSAVNIGNNSQPVKIALYNGTSTIGLTKTVENDLKGKLTNFEVVVKDNANKNYDKTLVIDLTGNNSDFAKNLAKEVNGETSTLPSGETKPIADVLIILGSNYIKK